MFAGHYAASLAAKAAEPRAPLWTYVVAAQLLDYGWGALIMTGVEKYRINPEFQGSTLDLYAMPWTHSLPAALTWSISGALLAILLLRVPKRAAVIIGLTVASHWLLDFIVHRPDLALWIGGPKVGLSGWNFPVPEQALEIGLLGMAGAALAWSRGRGGLGSWQVPAFLLLCLVVQIYAMFGGAGPNPMMTGVTVLAVYTLFALAAWGLERGDPVAAVSIGADKG